MDTEAADQFVLDIGGEGRHRDAWNLNPSPVKTCGPERGQPIPRWIEGRGDAIPLEDGVADVIIMERTPLLRAVVAEIRRVLKPTGTAILRHVRPLGRDPHRDLAELLPGQREQRTWQAGRHVLQETVIRLDPSRSASPLAERQGS